MNLPSPRGKTLHETLFDPRLFRLQAKQQVNLMAKQEFSGEAPGLFVGRFGYPDVRIGLLTTESYKQHDDPLHWVKEKTSLADIVTLRTQLVNAGKHAHVKLPSERMAEKVKELAQESAMAIRPIQVDIGLDKKPLFQLTREDDSLPHGPLADMKSAQLTSNAKIPSLISKVVDDTDLKASGGLGKLWRKGFSEHQLSKLLSAGTLGQKLERRLVPTRWSITAVDDTVGKQLQQQLIDFNESDFQVHFGGYMGNYFMILFLPQLWSFELYENFIGKETKQLETKYHDYEGVRGRSVYAENTAGGYYAARLALLDYLIAQKRKAGVIALRFITEEYWAPLGVWVVREAVRAALAEKPLTFGSLELMQTYACAFLQRKFGVSPQLLFDDSILLAERKSQTTLTQFA